MGLARGGALSLALVGALETDAGRGFEVVAEGRVLRLKLLIPIMGQSAYVCASILADKLYKTAGLGRRLYAKGGGDE